MRIRNPFSITADDGTDREGRAPTYHIFSPHLLLWRILALLLIVTGSIAAFSGLFSGQAVHAAPANNAVLTYKNDNARTGQYPNETILNTSNVNSSQFGKRVAYPVDGAVYAQPLYVPGVTINGAVHNVVIVATQNDSVYAFDADATGTTSPLWQTSFINPPTVTTVSSSDVSCSDITPQYGITATPVIDSSTGRIYVLANTLENGVNTYKLHALDLTSGQDTTTPTTITASVSGSGPDSVNGVITFDPVHELGRQGLLLLNGNVYLSFSGHCDNGNYHGWIMSYSASTLQQLSVYNDTPDGNQGGIWESGSGITADSSGNIYVISGNGSFDLNSGGRDASDSFLKLSTQNGLTVTDSFTPFNQACLSSVDADLGSGGALLLPTQSGSVPNELIGIGKEGRIYVVNRDNLGGYTQVANPCNDQSPTNIDQVVQELPINTANGGVWSTPAYWNGPTGQFVYVSGTRDHIKAFQLTDGKLSSSPTSESPESFSYPGGNPVVSSNGSATGTGILWSIGPDKVLHAYDATNLATELYTSDQNASRDALGSYVKFSVPTVANGEVFVGTQDSLIIYGLLNSTTTPTPTPSPTATPTTTPTPTPPPPPPYNNVGTSDDNNPGAANFDGRGNSYSAQALAASGITPGGTVTFNGVTFTWPTPDSGSPNNYQAQGQVIPVTAVNGATTIAFLGSASNGPSSGTAIITYTDGTTQTITLGFSDWTLNGGRAQPSQGNQIVATQAYRNPSGWWRYTKTYVFYSEFSLLSGKTPQSVTLPGSVNRGQIHVFAIGTK